MDRQMLSFLPKVLLTAGIGLSFLSGCGNYTQQVVTITQKPYEKISYQTTYVQRGNLKPSISLELSPQDYEEISYSAGKEELKLEKVHVSVGDRVQKGDILVSFESDEIRQKIAEYEDEKKQKELLAEHYENLVKVDETMEYQTDIKMLREDIRVAELYIEEAKDALAQYQIAAKEDGIIISLSEYLQNGIIKQGTSLLTEVCTTGRYQAAITEDDSLTVGDVYTVTGQKEEYELRLIDKTEETLIFEPVSDLSLLAGRESLTLTVEKPERKDVVYVDRQAVYTVEDSGEEDSCYVYVMGDNGYQRAVFVTSDECIGDNMIITEGLSGGEEVVIR